MLSAERLVNMSTRAALHDASACWHVCKSYAVSASCQRTTLLHFQKRSRSTLYLSPQECLAYLNKRLNEVPQFGAYAITSGLKRAFSAFGRLARSIARIVPRTEKVDLSQYLPGFAELLDLDDG